MAYTPELTQEHSCTLRRIAWALELPMTKTMQEVFNYLPDVIDRQLVCSACKDKTKCGSCAFASN